LDPRERILAGPLVAAALCAGSACSPPAPEPPAWAWDGGAEAALGPVQVARRTAVLPNYPCSQCHLDRPRAPAASRRRGAAPEADGGPSPELRLPDPRPRPLRELHERIELSHGELAGWCYGCHGLRSIDRLELPDETLVSFDEPERLCGACHGLRLADWRAGIHDLVTGGWNGPKLSRACPDCHDPHAPRFAPLVPLPPPAPPRVGAVRTSSEGVP
ncbi:MAG: hypothetical protein HY744_16265, partial [Deltaproteobacteria bacterium]|nr:hypothetical protein [Deltaproteobacteria bacterium]